MSEQLLKRYGSFISHTKKSLFKRDFLSHKKMVNLENVIHISLMTKQIWLILS